MKKTEKTLLPPMPVNPATTLESATFWYKGYHVQLDAELAQDNLPGLYMILVEEEEQTRKQAHLYREQLDRFVQDPDEPSEEDKLMFIMCVCFLTWMNELENDEHNGVLLMYSMEKTPA